MITFHYSKRVYESIWIHIQINTMELKMFFVECLYYILYFGIFAQKQIFDIDINHRPSFIFVILFFISEINNLHCHIILRSIRLNNKFQREIPTGNIFNLVYCANYFWEICSWLSLSIYSSLKSFYFFTFMGGVIMSMWALEKKNFYTKMLHKKNLDINKNKMAIIPFIL